MPSYEPPPQTQYFTGRKKQLDYLYERTRTRFLSNPVAVVGPAGIGKTALVNEFVHQNTRRKTFWIQASEIRALGEDLGNLIKDITKQGDSSRATVVLDGLDETDDLANYVIQILALRRVHSFIVTSRGLSDGFPQLDAMHLEGLNEKDSVSLIRKLAPTKINPRQLVRLVKKTNGHPLALILVAQLLSNHTIEQIELQLKGDWDNLQLKLPVGDQRIIETIVPKIIVANDAIIYELKKRPQDLHGISPRRFEELIAELLDNMGWEVKLTPESKDGGKDIIAVLKTDLGKFLTLVEAKHYNPKRPVQVGLVRQLFGTFVDHGANSAMLVTSSRFTKGAKDFQQKHEYQLTLADYGNVISWIQKYQLPKKKL